MKVRKPSIWLKNQELREVNFGLTSEWIGRFLRTAALKDSMTQKSPDYQGQLLQSPRTVYLDLQAKKAWQENSSFEQAIPGWWQLQNMKHIGSKSGERQPKRNKEVLLKHVRLESRKIKLCGSWQGRRVWRKKIKELLLVKDMVEVLSDFFF